MPIVRVFGNTHINTDAVSKVTLEVNFDGDIRINTTTIFDRYGGDSERRSVLEKFETKVDTNLSTSQSDVARDNHTHAEILAALKEGRDALAYSDGSSHG